MVFAVDAPMRQAFMNGIIPSEQRATVLSFDNLMGSAGGVVAQPALGRVADVYSYGTSYVIAAAISGLLVAVHPARAARACPPTRYESQSRAHRRLRLADR